MHLSKSLLLAAAASATGAAAADQVVAYWGNGGYTPSDGNLADWCGANEHIDILILAFLSKFGNGNFPQGSLGGCTVNGDGSSSGCDQLSKDITACQNQGKKVFLSLGGAQDDGSTGYKLNSKGDAEGVAYSLWNSFGDPAHSIKGSPRPLGNARVDGWDIDLEANPNNEDGQGYLADMLNSLRSRWAVDPNHKYYISGAPQCPHPDGNIGNSIQNAQYDYLFIQFYNNFCSAADVYKDTNQNPDGSGGRFNLDEWPGVISSGASRNAKLYVGLPGNSQEATSFDFVDSSNLPKVYNAAKGVKGFSGFMVYEVGDTKSVGTKNGCDYFQQLSHVMQTGKAC